MRIASAVFCAAAICPAAGPLPLKGSPPGQDTQTDCGGRVLSRLEELCRLPADGRYRGRLTIDEGGLGEGALEEGREFIRSLEDGPLPWSAGKEVTSKRRERLAWRLRIFWRQERYRYSSDELCFVQWPRYAQVTRGLIQEEVPPVETYYYRTGTGHEVIETRDDPRKAGTLYRREQVEDVRWSPGGGLLFKSKAGMLFSELIRALRRTGTYQSDSSGERFSVEFE